MIPELELSWMPPPPPLGSGKFGTPCARMHSENARNPLLLALPAGPVPLFDVVVDGADEPHAATVIAQNATIAAARTWWLIDCTNRVVRGGG